jgi:recombinational DNA repair ATPase RecF
MKLTNVQIHKYKSIETDQSFDVQDRTTVLVGMNEAGKTSVLEAIA